LFLKFEFFPLKTQHYQMPEAIEKSASLSKM
jgi:hypothetical protein